MITSRMSGPRWDYLLPEMRRRATLLLEEADRLGLSVVFWEGYRNEDEQRGMMAKGVSWVTDPLLSFHTWGAAVDIVLCNALGEPDWKLDCDDPRWQRLGGIGEGLGLTWGGRWGRKCDCAHFQSDEVSPKELLAAYGRDPLTFLRENGVRA